MNAVAGAPVAVLFVQGAGDGAHAADQPLADALARELGAGFRVVFPQLPGEDDPDEATWKRAIADAARDAGASVVVAHSAGAANTADLLAEGGYGTRLPRLDGLFLLAPPFMGPGGWPLAGFHFDHATSRQALAGLPLHFYFGAADATVPATHADLYEPVFPDATFHRLPRCDHQFTGHIAHIASDIRRVLAAA